MPRPSPRVAFSGPFRGEHQLLPPEAMGLDLCSTAENLENIRGYWRPRRGHACYTAGANNTVVTLQPTSCNGLWSFRLEGTRVYDDLLYQESTGTLWRRAFRKASTDTIQWVRVSADPLNVSAGYDFVFGSIRDWGYIADDRVMFVRNRPWVFQRQKLVPLDSTTSLPSASGTTQLECSGTLVGATSTTATLAASVGSTSYDRIYTDDQCEIEVTSPAGVKQVAQISAYDHTGGASERLISISGTWVTTPDNTYTYQIYRIIFRASGLAEPPTAYSFTGANSAGTDLPASTAVEYAITQFDVFTQVESNPYLFSWTTGAAPNSNVKITWTSPNTIYSNVRTDRHASHLKFYRRNVAGSEATYQYVGTHTISNGATGFTDNTSDANRAEETAQFDHNQITDGYSWGCFHRGQNYVAHLTQNIIYYSKSIDQVSGASGTEYFPDSNYFTLPGLGAITRMESYGTQLIVWQRDRVYAIDTSPLPDTPYINEIKGAPGTLSPFSFAHSDGSSPTKPNRLFYGNDVGFYEFNGVSAQCFTDPIRPTWEAITTTYDVENVTAVYDCLWDRLMIAYRANGDTRHRRVLIYDPYTESLLRWKLPNTSAAAISAACIGYLYDGTKVVLTGFAGGLVGWWASPVINYTTDNGTDIDWTLTTPRIDFGDPTARKHWYDAAAQFKVYSGAPVVSVAAYLDQDSSAVTSNSQALGTYFDAPIHVGAECTHASLVLSGNNTAGVIERITGLVFTHEPRRLRG